MRDDEVLEVLLNNTGALLSKSIHHKVPPFLSRSVVKTLVDNLHTGLNQRLFCLASNLQSQATIRSRVLTVSTHLNRPREGQTRITLFWGDNPQPGSIEMWHSLSYSEFLDV
jgi:hypothetical protein